jgi:hypothetical protein
MKRISGRFGRRDNGPVRRVGKLFEHLLFEKRNLRYDVLSGDTKPPQLTPVADGMAKEKKFFIWIRCNPLKSPNSTKGIQGNASDFPCICLVLAWRIWSKSGKIEA